MNICVQQFSFIFTIRKCRRSLNFERFHMITMDVHRNRTQKTLRVASNFVSHHFDITRLFTKRQTTILSTFNWNVLCFLHFCWHHNRVIVMEQRPFESTVILAYKALKLRGEREKNALFMFNKTRFTEHSKEKAVFDVGKSENCNKQS